MKIFQVPATLEGISSLKDNGVSLRFHTQELTADQKSEVFNYQNSFGWLLFKDSEKEFDMTEFKELEAIRRDIGGKSPSQRLRSVLYVLYEQQGEKSLSFEQYYASQIEKVINNIKDRLV